MASTQTQAPSADTPDAVIDLARPEAVQYWTRQLRASEAVLREAVDAAGPKDEAVRQYLASGS